MADNRPSSSSMLPSLHHPSQSLALTYSPPVLTHVLHFESIPDLDDPLPLSLLAEHIPDLDSLFPDFDRAFESHSIDILPDCFGLQSHISRLNVQLDHHQAFPLQSGNVSPLEASASSTPITTMAPTSTATPDHQSFPALPCANGLLQRFSPEASNSNIPTTSSPPTPYHSRFPSSSTVGTIFRAQVNTEVNEVVNHEREDTIRGAVMLQVRTDQLNLNDGYVWRKYGEKKIKNRMFRRSYYRCAHTGCNIQKLSERSSEEPEVLTVTYYGRHNHVV